MSAGEAVVRMFADLLAAGAAVEPLTPAHPEAEAGPPALDVDAAFAQLLHPAAVDVDRGSLDSARKPALRTDVNAPPVAHRSHRQSRRSSGKRHEDVPRREFIRPQSNVPWFRDRHDLPESKPTAGAGVDRLGLPVHGAARPAVPWFFDRLSGLEPVQVLNGNDNFMREVNNREYLRMTRPVVSESTATKSHRTRRVHASRPSAPMTDESDDAPSSGSSDESDSRRPAVGQSGARQQDARRPPDQSRDRRPVAAPAETRPPRETERRSPGDASAGPRIAGLGPVARHAAEQAAGALGNIAGEVRGVLGGVTTDSKILEHIMAPVTELQAKLASMESSDAERVTERATAAVGSLRKEAVESATAVAKEDNDFKNARVSAIAYYNALLYVARAPGDGPAKSAKEIADVQSVLSGAVVVQAYMATPQRARRDYGWIENRLRDMGVSFASLIPASYLSPTDDTIKEATQLAQQFAAESAISFRNIGISAEGVDRAVAELESIAGIISRLVRAGLVSGPQRISSVCESFRQALVRKYVSTMPAPRARTTEKSPASETGPSRTQRTGATGSGDALHTSSIRPDPGVDQDGSHAPAVLRVRPAARDVEITDTTEEPPDPAIAPSRVQAGAGVLGRVTERPLDAVSSTRLVAASTGGADSGAPESVALPPLLAPRAIVGNADALSVTSQVRQEFDRQLASARAERDLRIYEPNEEAADLLRLQGSVDAGATPGDIVNMVTAHFDTLRLSKDPRKPNMLTPIRKKNAANLNDTPAAASASSASARTGPGPEAARGASPRVRATTTNQSGTPASASASSASASSSGFLTNEQLTARIQQIVGPVLDAFVDHDASVVHQEIRLLQRELAVTAEENGGLTAADIDGANGVRAFSERGARYITAARNYGAVSHQIETDYREVLGAGLAAENRKAVQQFLDWERAQANRLIYPSVEDFKKSERSHRIAQALALLKQQAAPQANTPGAKSPVKDSSAAASASKSTAGEKPAKGGQPDVTPGGGASSSSDSTAPGHDAKKESPAGSQGGSSLLASKAVDGAESREESASGSGKKMKEAKSASGAPASSSAASGSDTQARTALLASTAADNGAADEGGSSSSGKKTGDIGSAGAAAASSRKHETPLGSTGSSGPHHEPERSADEIRWDMALNELQTDIDRIIPTVQDEASKGRRTDACTQNMTTLRGVKGYAYPLGTHPVAQTITGWLNITTAENSMSTARHIFKSRLNAHCNQRGVTADSRTSSGIDKIIDDAAAGLDYDRDKVDYKRPDNSDIVTNYQRLYDEAQREIDARIDELIARMSQSSSGSAQAPVFAPVSASSTQTRDQPPKTPADGSITPPPASIHTAAPVASSGSTQPPVERTPDAQKQQPLVLSGSVEPKVELTSQEQKDRLLEQFKQRLAYIPDDFKRIDISHAEALKSAGLDHPVSAEAYGQNLKSILETRVPQMEAEYADSEFSTQIRHLRVVGATEPELRAINAFAAEKRQDVITSHRAGREAQSITRLPRDGEIMEEFSRSCQLVIGRIAHDLIQELEGDSKIKPLMTTASRLPSAEFRPAQQAFIRLATKMADTAPQNRDQVKREMITLWFTAAKTPYVYEAHTTLSGLEDGYPAKDEAGREERRRVRNSVVAEYMGRLSAGGDVKLERLPTFKTYLQLVRGINDRAAALVMAQLMQDKYGQDEECSDVVAEQDPNGINFSHYVVVFAVPGAKVDIPHDDPGAPLRLHIQTMINAAATANAVDNTTFSLCDESRIHRDTEFLVRVYVFSSKLTGSALVDEYKQLATLVLHDDYPSIYNFMGATFPDDALLKDTSQVIDDPQFSPFSVPGRFTIENIATRFAQPMGADATIVTPSTWLVA